jgi:hypothetical protein
MIAVMEERDRELARRSKDAWKQAAPPARTPRMHKRAPRPRSRLSSALARGVAFFG